MDLENNSRMHRLADTTYRVKYISTHHTELLAGPGG